MIKSAVRKLILENVTAASLLGSVRVFPSRLPSKYVLPSVVLTTISTMPQTAHSGNSGRVTITDIQVTILAESEEKMISLEREIIDALDLQNTDVVLGATTVSILASFLEDAQDLQGYEYEKENEIVRTIDFSFIWR